MVDLYFEKQLMKELEESLETINSAFNFPLLNAELERFKAEQNTEDFWNNVENAQAVSQKIVLIEKKINLFSRLKSHYEDSVALINLIEEMDEENEIPFLKSELAKLKKELDATSIQALLTGKYDFNNAILSLHAGAGGTEAQDWAEMLYRMYTRYAERQGYKIKVLDYLQGEEAGIKSVTFLLEGDNAYGFMKAEKGVHRLVRISPFDANKKRHTSFASLDVMPEINNNDEIVIASDDLRVDTYRASGAGGQHVNKTDSAIRITHLPTNIVVQCQNERSQIQNRETAMKMLKSKLIELKEANLLAEQQNIKGALKKIEWGSQIRSYVFCPYTLTKDHRTGYENTNINAVMDGDIEGFIIDYLTKQ